MGPYYLRGAYSPLAARASMMAIFLLMTPLCVVFFIWSKVGGTREILLALVLFVPVLAGDWLGHRAFGKVTARQWETGTALVLLAAAAAALWKLLA